MKNLLSLFLALLLVIPTADAQRRKKMVMKKKPVPGYDYAQNFSNFEGYEGDQTAQERMQQMAQIRRYDSTYSFITRHRYGGWSRTINEETEGVMGRDEIRLNEKGEHRNLNSNTGVPLPPNNGR